MSDFNPVIKQGADMKIVTEHEYKAFVAAYPRKLAFSEYEPFDVYQDPALGRWPVNIVARKDKGTKTVFSILS